MMDIKPKPKTDSKDGLHPVARIIDAYKNEAHFARISRMSLNADNFNCYHNRAADLNKTRGQSQEFLPKMSQSVEQITSFLQQGLMDQGDWFRIDPEYGVVVNDALIKPKEIELLTLRQIEKNNFPNYMQDALKLGLIGALMIGKIEGVYKTKSKYVAKDAENSILSGKKKLVRIDKKFWQANISLVRQEDWYPDPTGNGLYTVQRIEMDFHQLVQMAEDNSDVFDLDSVHSLQDSGDQELQKGKKARETGQNTPYNEFRKRVTLYECWGDFVDEQGNVLYENSQAIMSANRTIIMHPRKNPYWHGMSPYVVAPILRVPHSVWHKAMMDSTTQLNYAQNEMFNLMVDGAMSAVHGIRQLRVDWLDDPSQVSGGIAPGTVLKVNSQCPTGAKIMERVDTGAVPQETLQMYQMLDRELLSSSFSNDTRTGALPARQVKATEIASANQTITGVFNGIVKTIETEFVSELLERIWLTMAQYMDDVDEDEVTDLIGKDRAMAIANLQPEERFAATASGHKFNVFGLSQTLNKIQDFRKITSLMQSIGGSPALMAEFQKEYSMTALLGEIIKSLDIDEQKIKATPQEIAQAQAQQAAAQAAMNQQNGAQGQQQPDNMSQVPQMAATQPENGTAKPQINLNQGMTQP